MAAIAVVAVITADVAAITADAKTIRDAALPVQMITAGATAEWTETTDADAGMSSLPVLCLLRRQDRPVLLMKTADVIKTQSNSVPGQIRLPRHNNSCLLL